MIPDSKYCETCGGCYGDNIPVEAEHTCPFPDGEPDWCRLCGAEVMDTGSCDNDHSEDDAGPDPEISDAVQACPDCDRPNQFGEVCAACERDRQDALDADRGEG